ncbi:YqaE/Pmp3 family membrane protein [Virgibacillus salexigens]|uniref:YqaE/Pmp3 family membrane protein n=1 Tax=Virgibacillus salexigens TaxID=61016 RepID=UPI00190A0139|nr:YqaE/Pmp3 family membrane protein [Virgibacillus salexigens]
MQLRFLAIIVPPVAVLFCGKPIQALINFGLWCLLIIPGVIHAWGVVSDYKADKRMNKHTKAMQNAN